MHLTTFELEGQLLLGCQLGDRLLQLDRAYEHWVGEVAPPWLRDMRALLAAGETALKKAKLLEAKCRELLRNPRGERNWWTKG